VEGKPFNFTIAVDSSGNFTQITTDNPTVVALLSGNSVTLSNLQYAIPPTYALSKPNSLVAAKTKKKKRMCPGKR
jgi:hypothetical protein